MTIDVSVIVAAYNRKHLLRECLRALQAQNLPKEQFEIIVVDDGSTDGTASVAGSFDVRVLRQPHLGVCAARNAGLRAARGEWVAFTDSDCIPSRTWLPSLLTAVRPADGKPPALGAAGPTFGYKSTSPAARFVDLTAGLSAEQYLAHPLFPYAPTANLMYGRDALEAVGGFDSRFTAYEACDLSLRLRRVHEGEFVFAPRAVVLHRHRATWTAYWRQQLWYGRGYGQFLLSHRDEVGWSMWREAQAWGRVAGLGLAACRPGRGDDALVRRGRFVKGLAQRIGCFTTYWNPVERRRW